MYNIINYINQQLKKYNKIYKHIERLVNITWDSLINDDIDLIWNQLAT